MTQPDPAAPTGGARREALLVPLADPGRAAELAAWLGLDADVVPGRRGALVVPRSEVVDDDVAVRASRVLRGGDLLVLRLAEERVGVARWRGGRLADEPPFGALGDLGDDAERVLLGRLSAAEAEGATSTDGVSRTAFSRSVVAAARGPVRTWQIVLQVALAVVAAFLAAVAALAVLGGEGVWAWVRLVLWSLLTVFWVAATRGLLHRRAQERAAAGQGGLEPPR